MTLSTPLIGRETEIQQIRQTLANPACQLLTLIGMGGIGKTRLASYIYQEMTNLPDGVVWISLETLSTSDEILFTLARHPHFEGVINSAQEVLPYLKNKTMLIILDQYEHLAPHADWIQPLLSSCPHVKWLVTSQIGLNISTGWQIYIHPLSWGDENSASYQLFAYHANRLGRENIIQTDSTAITQICHHLEGHPLAIQLVCRWLKTLSPQDILNHLHRFDLFQATYTDMPSRQRNLWGVLHQVWELLHPQEQRLLSQLAFFDGDFNLDAIFGCCDATLPMLEGLVNRSLLNNQDGRYRLHSLIRQFVSHHAPPQDYFIRRYSDYYVGLITTHAVGIKDERYIPTQRLFDVEYANLRKGYHQAILLGNHTSLEIGLMNFFLYTHTRGRNTDFFKWLTFTKEQVKSHTPLWIVATFIQNYISVSRGDTLTDEQIQAIKLCSQYAKTHRMNDIVAHLIRLEGDIAMHQENYRKALSAFERTENLFLELGDEFELARTANRIGVIHLYLGNFEEASTHFEQSLAIKREKQIYIEWIASLNNLANLKLWMGNKTEAKRHTQEMHRISEKIQFRVGKLQALQLDAFIGFLDGDKSPIEAYQAYIQSNQFFIWGKHTHVIIYGLSHLMNHAPNEALSCLETIQPDDSFERFWYSWCLGWASLQNHQMDKLYSHISTLIPIVKYFQADLMNFMTLLFCGIWFSQNHQTSQAESILSALSTHPIGAWGIFRRWITPATKPLPEDLYQRLVRIAPQFEPKNMPTSDIIPSLSTREIEILALVAQDYSNQDIAEKCALTVGTVKVHLHRIYQKLGVTGRVQAVKVAQTYRLLPLD